MLRPIAGFFLGILILLTLAMVGVVRFLPDVGRYYRISHM
jgi:hypothetical protein